MKVLAKLMLYIMPGLRLLAADSWSCATELRIPQYPLLARQARLIGKASVSLRIDQYGKPREILVEGVHKLLEKAVTDSVRLSRFVGRCENQMVHLEFIFELEDPPKQADSGYVIFRPPNIFVLRAATFPMSGQTAHDR